MARGSKEPKPAVKDIEIIQTEKESPSMNSAMPLFYQDPIALNSNQHKELKVGESPNKFQFAAKTNSVVVAAIEMIEACKEFPVVFSAIGDKIVPIALLGLRNDENLFVKEDGSWDGRYIPAYIRRYPFILADSGNDQLTVCFDQAYDGLDSDEGTPVFDAEGNQTEKTRHIVAFMQDFHQQVQRTEQLSARLKEYGLFKEMDAAVSMKDGRRLGLKGFMVVDEAKLLQLSKDKAYELFKDGSLSLVYAHLLSLGNMAGLVDKLAGRE